MYCHNCGKQLAKAHINSINNWTWAVLPGRTVAVPVCLDDRLCEVVHKKCKPKQVSMPKYKKHAKRFVQ